MCSSFISYEPGKNCVLNALLKNNFIKYQPKDKRMESHSSHHLFVLFVCLLTEEEKKRVYPDTLSMLRAF